MNICQTSQDGLMKYTEVTLIHYVEGKSCFPMFLYIFACWLCLKVFTITILRKKFTSHPHPTAGPPFSLFFNCIDTLAMKLGVLIVRIIAILIFNDFLMYWHL